MKRVLSLTGILAIVIVLTSAISIGESPQDPPRRKKGQKHIKMIKIGDDGKKMEIDTVLENDQFFVWNGDTIGGGKEMEWISKGDFDMDFDIDVETDEDGNVFVLKSGDGRYHRVMEFKTGNDSAKGYKIMITGDGEDIMKWHGKHQNEMIFAAPHRAHAPKVIRMDKKSRGNVIDLSDPGIISYEKKELKDGKEKITIIREKPEEKEVVVHEEVIIHDAHHLPVPIHEGHPNTVKQIKVIADDEGHIEIFEDGEIWSTEELEEGTKVIEKDGRKIIIKKHKEGEEIEVDVEVEEIHEEEEKE